jgi:hypothetical protein
MTTTVKKYKYKALEHQGRRLYVIHTFVQPFRNHHSSDNSIQITHFNRIRGLRRSLRSCYSSRPFFYLNSGKKAVIYRRVSFDINPFNIVEEKRWAKVRFILSLLQVAQVNQA